jgi:hypothetical protein
MVWVTISFSLRFADIWRYQIVYLPDRSLLNNPDAFRLDEGGLDVVYALAEHRDWTRHVVCPRSASEAEVTRCIIAAFPPDLQLGVRGFWYAQSPGFSETH